jgi:uncharacterized OsmC-like protein
MGHREHCAPAGRLRPPAAATLEAVTAFVVTHPEAAHLVPRADGELVGPFEVRVAVADHRVTVDEPSSIGGADAAPSPVDMALVSLASCQAITYRLWAVKLGVHIAGIRVAVDADYDARGLLGVEGYDRPGFSAARVVVTIQGAWCPARTSRCSGRRGRSRVCGWKRPTWAGRTVTARWWQGRERPSCWPQAVAVRRWGT